MFKDDFKQRYTTIPFAVYRAYCEFVRGGVISHQHKEIEIIAMSEGAADIYINGKLYRVEKGDVLVIPPYSIHRAETSPEKLTAYNCICFDIGLLCDRELTAGLIEHTHELVHLISHDTPESRLLQEYVEKGCAACESQESGWELEAIGNMSLIFALIKKGGYFFSTGEKHAGNSFAQKVLDHISESYSRETTSKDVAEALYMNNSYFCRAFKKTFGCCFSDYLLAYRLEKARTWLVNTNLSVTEISLETGFNSCSYFGKAFKERFGASPLAYRRQTRENT